MDAVSRTTPERARGRGQGAARERILAAAARLFAHQGINATGMEQIAEAAPVSKRTLYAHFRTKGDLVLAHLQALASSGDTLEGVLTREDLGPRERILGLFDPPAAGAPGTASVRGCPFIDAAAEFPDPESPIHRYAREQKLRMVRLVTELLEELGCPRPAALAEQVVTLADGVASRAMVLNQADYGRHARAAAEVLLGQALDGAG
ncbi:TetR/AcrR family transcriptional regulator [Streptomyces sp. RS10V-4]|uniref:TetR/AcrR family transcriptional regulator n=1 Tax=Streptomyces rhizoryzae TaxID=2932493 RepID=UPI002003F2FC|nr:TetR/AcrR family transcriptional regulator [Streptomyces rhizoryzae]MCK7622345.1 TetR/AcrR family transcriptional regulator [Streptomyces rhizoryzae]